MPTDWIPNSGTQIERAIRALFISQGAATVDDCFISNDSRHRGSPVNGLTEILAVQSSTSEAEPSGNETWLVRIQNRFGAALQVEETNPQMNRVEMDKRVGRQQLELMQGTYSLSVTCTNITAAGRALAVSDGSDEGDLQAQNEADMVEFTCQFGRYLGATRGKPEDDSCLWVEVRNFEFVACPSNVD